MLGNDLWAAGGQVHRWVQRLRRRPVPEDLSLECERFLHGDYEAYLVGRKAAVPAWARLNTVAHADLRRLQLLAAAASTPCADAWAAAQHAIALEVLKVASDACPAAQVQRERLVPLESLLASGRSLDALAPRQLQAIASAVVRRPTVPER